MKSSNNDSQPAHIICVNKYSSDDEMPDVDMFIVPEKLEPYIHALSDNLPIKNSDQTEPWFQDIENLETSNRQSRKRAAYLLLKKHGQKIVPTKTIGINLF